MQASRHMEDTFSDSQQLGYGRVFLFDPQAYIGMSVSGSGHLQHDELSRAIKSISNAYPLLKCRVCLEDYPEVRLRYDSQIWPACESMKGKRTSSEFLRNMEALDWIHPAQGSLCKIILNQAGDRWDLGVVCHHLISDGIFLVHLIKKLLSLSAGLEQTLEPQALNSLTPVNWASLVHKPPPAVSRMFIKWLNRSWHKHYSEADLSVLIADNMPGKSNVGISSRELSTAETGAVVQHCKRVSVSVNSALITASSRSVVKFPELQTRMSMAVDLRPRFAPPLGAEPGFYASGFGFEVHPASGEFWNAVSTVHQKLQRWLSSDRVYQMLLMDQIEATLMDAINLHIWAGYQNRVAEKVAARLGFTRKLIGVGLTNIGDQSNAFRGLGVQSCHFIPHLPRNVQILVGVVTTNDQLSLTAKYAQDRMSPTLVENYLDTLVRTLDS